MGRALEIRDDVGAHELRGWARKAVAEAHPDKTIELRFQDEARVGSKGRLGHRWWIKAYRAPGLSDKRFQWAYIFAAVHPATGEDVALALPEVSTIAMAIFLEGVAAAPCPPIKI